MRSASIASTRRAAHSRSSASVAGGSARAAAQLAGELRELARASAGSPCQSSQVVSSNVACAASSATGKPAMISSPRSPSTSLSRVVGGDDPFESAAAP